MNERLEKLVSDESVRLVARLAGELGAGAWLAGGCVRDALAGRRSRDLDFVLSEGCPELPRRFAERWGGAFFWLDEVRLQGRVVKQSAAGLLVRDFAPLRGAAIEEDLRLRDFTINALALPVAGGGVIDPTGGCADLDGRVIRGCGDHAFADDPLRLLRAIRFAAELGFIVEPETWSAILRKSDLLEAVAAERIRDEFFRIIALPGVGTSFQLLGEAGLLRHILPAGLRRLSSGRYSDNHRGLEARIGHAGSVEAVCCEAGQLVPDREETLAEYLATETESGIPHLSLMKLAAFLGGTDRGNVEALAGKLRLGRRTERLLGLLCGDLSELPAQYAGRRVLFRFFRDREPAGPGLVIVARANGTISCSEALLLLRYYLEEYNPAADDLFLSGRDVMALLGIGEGEAVGEALAALREAEGRGLVSDREEAAAFVKNLLTSEAPMR